MTGVLADKNIFGQHKIFSRNIFRTILRWRRRGSGGVFSVCRFVAEKRVDTEAAGLLQQLRLEVMLERLLAHRGSRFEALGWRSAVTSSADCENRL